MTELKENMRVKGKPGTLEAGQTGTVESIMPDGLVYVGWDKDAWWNGYIMERPTDLEVLPQAA